MVNRAGPAATLSGYPVELLREWLRASCEGQGVPVAVRDAQVVANVAVLLGVSSPQGRGSEAPDGTYPGRIEPVSGRRFSDDDVVQHG